MVTTTEGTEVGTLLGEADKEIAYADTPALPATSLYSPLKINVLLASSISTQGVNTPIQVMLSVEVITLKLPFRAVMSVPLKKPRTASENTRVTLVLSPALKKPSAIVNDVTLGFMLSIFCNGHSPFAGHVSVLPLNIAGQ